MIKVGGFELWTEREDDTKLQMLIDLIKFNSVLLGYEMKSTDYPSFRSAEYNHIIRWEIGDGNFLVSIFFHLRKDYKLMEISSRIECKEPKIRKVDIDDVEGPETFELGLNTVKYFLEHYKKTI